jgi:hypothetical protein
VLRVAVTAQAAALSAAPTLPQSRHSRWSAGPVGGPPPDEEPELGWEMVTVGGGVASPVKHSAVGGQQQDDDAS